VLFGTLASLFAPFWRLDAKGGEEVYYHILGFAWLSFIWFGFIAFETLGCIRA
jgi:hypothetical protein